MAQDNGYETLLVQREDGIATITLNRPKVLNALCHQMIVDLIAALTTLGYFCHLISLGLTAVGLVVLELATPGAKRTHRFSPHIS